MKIILFILFTNQIFAQQFDYSKWQSVINDKIDEQKIIIIKPKNCTDYLDLKQELEKDEIRLEAVRIDPNDGGSGGGGGGPGISN